LHAKSHERDDEKPNQQKHKKALVWVAGSLFPSCLQAISFFFVVHYYVFFCVAVLSLGFSVLAEMTTFGRLFNY